LEFVVLKGDKMEAMIYHETVSLLDRLLVEGKVYSFTNVQVKDAPEMFRSVNNKYVFVLTIQTEVEERHPDGNFPLYVDMINSNMIERFPGEEHVYYSFDSAEDDTNNNYPIEFLNTLNPGGLPPHLLKLKVGCPIILLRNIDPANGLCNGTRLICRSFQRNVIDAEIAVGEHAGKRIFLPRIPLCPSDDDMFPFKMKRKQFPIRLSFAMTINKAQGQTIPHVGVYLPEPVFSHGQLYVALSRGTSRANTKVLVKPVGGIHQNGVYTSNVVYQEVLEG
jgi:ATP-dependent DNA helicase PIF1